MQIVFTSAQSNVSVVAGREQGFSAFHFSASSTVMELIGKWKPLHLSICWPFAAVLSICQSLCCVAVVCCLGLSICPKIIAFLSRFIFSIWCLLELWWTSESRQSEHSFNTNHDICSVVCLLLLYFVISSSALKRCCQCRASQSQNVRVHFENALAELLTVLKCLTCMCRRTYRLIVVIGYYTGCTESWNEIKLRPTVQSTDRFELTVCLEIIQFGNRLR